MIESDCLTMTVTQEDFQEKWETKEKKVMLRGSVPPDIANFVAKIALTEFGLDQAARGKALTKLIMIAKDCLEKQELTE
jgi:hypothetical protein